MDLHNHQQRNRHEAWRGTHNRWNFHPFVSHTNSTMDVTRKQTHRACSLLLLSCSQTHAHTFRGGMVAVIWPRCIGSCCFVGSYRAHCVKMPHSWQRAENGLEVKATGWKQEAQAISVRNAQKQRWSVLFAPRTKSERQRPSHYFRICGSRQQTLRATNPAFTTTYWGMRREANMGENIVHYWETSGNGVLSVFFCFSSSKKDYGKCLGILTQH